MLMSCDKIYKIWSDIIYSFFIDIFISIQVISRWRNRIQGCPEGEFSRLSMFSIDMQMSWRSDSYVFKQMFESIRPRSFVSKSKSSKGFWQFFSKIISIMFFICVLRLAAGLGIIFFSSDSKYCRLRNSG